MSITKKGEGVLLKFVFIGVLISGLLLGCDSGKEPMSIPCIDASRAYAIPSPAWGAGDDFAPPDGDKAYELTNEVRPSWAAQLHLAGGWSHMPTVIIPLFEKAQDVDAQGVLWFGAAKGDGTLRKLEILQSVELMDDGRYLVIKPKSPLDPHVERVVVVVLDGAVSGAKAMAVCDADGRAFGQYYDALDELPEDVHAQLALPFSLSNEYHALGALWDNLNASPVFRLESMEAKPLDELGTKEPSPEVLASMRPVGARGILELPDYRGDDGIMSLSTDGAPAAQGISKPGIVVTIPAQGQPPYPVLFFQHGGTGDKGDFLAWADELAAAGFAIVSIDLPYHGDRAGPQGGTDMDILDFENLLATRDNLRQATADHMAVLTGLDELNAALEPIFDTSEALDKSKIFYMGISLGALTGSLTFSCARNLSGAALFVGAANFGELVRYGVFSMFIGDVLRKSPMETEVLLALAEVLMDGGDPGTYAIRAEDRELVPRPILLFQAVDEAIIDVPVSDFWGLCFGADLALPSHHQVLGMDEISLPAKGNFSWTGEEQKATRLLIQNPMEEFEPSARHGALIKTDYAQQQAVHCFSSFLSTGSCEVIDTGYMDH